MSIVAELRVFLENRIRRRLPIGSTPTERNPSGSVHDVAPGAVGVAGVVPAAAGDVDDLAARHEHVPAERLHAARCVVQPPRGRRAAGWLDGSTCQTNCPPAGTASLETRGSVNVASGAWTPSSSTRVSVE